MFWAIGIAASVALPVIDIKRNRLQQGRRAAQNCVKKALAACGSAYGYPDKHTRANVMLLKDGRRKVDTATAFNMDGDSDQDLEIDATAGVSGEAFVSRVAVYGDLSITLSPGGPTWGLRDSERAKVRSGLKSRLAKARRG